MRDVIRDIAAGAGLRPSLLSPHPSAVEWMCGEVGAIAGTANREASTLASALACDSSSRLTGALDQR